MADYISKYETGTAVDAALDLAMSALQPESGKGLSTNDFTNEYKDKADSNDAEISSARGSYTTVNDRLNAIESEQESQETTLDGDRAALVEIVDSGAKNLLKNTAVSQTISGVKFTVNADKSVTLSGTATSNITSFFISREVPALTGNMVLSGCPAGGSSTTYKLDILDGTASGTVRFVDTGEGTDVDWSLITTGIYTTRIRIQSGTTVDGLIFKPMLCTAENYAISPEFVPYAMSNRELTEEVETNKNNISTDEAALVELVDSGAKNLLKITATSGTVSGVTYTVNADQTITFNGKAEDMISLDLSVPATVSGKSYFVSGCPAGGATSNTYRQLIRDVTNQQNLGSDIGNGAVITFPNPIGNIVVRINIFSGYTAKNLTFKPMICTKAAWDISQAYQPFRPSYQELYERVVALEQTNQ